MLTRLFIRNYAIIPELDLAIAPGLSIITGETGAGKSILLGALGLALGRRADSRVLPDEKAKCIVEAHFQLTDTSLEEQFKSEGLDFDNILICRREISGGGRSRAFINDTPVQLKVLQDLTSQLIELHHQNDNLALQSREYQVNALDTISGSLVLKDQYQSLYKQLITTNNDLNKSRELEASSARRKDFLLFQIEELDQANLAVGEVVKLEESQNVLQHAEAIDQALDQLQLVLQEGPHAIEMQLTNLLRQIDLVRHVSTSLAMIGDRINALRIETQDLAMEAARYDGAEQKDPAHLVRIQARLSQLYTLIKKYQAKSDEELIHHHKTLKKELSELVSVHEQILETEKKIELLLKELNQKGDLLSKQRKAGIKKMIPRMNELLIELGMPNGKFSIDIIPHSSPGHDGMDDITFLFSANKGVEMQPLQVVASGGELSRLSLALKSLYAAQAKLPTIIFDEIDTGISGEVAWRMGQLIRTLAKGHQVLMITHSPQIAAYAGTQYHVSKTETNDKETSSVQLLSAAQRIVEIAKMLSGDPPSKEALANANSLINATRH